MSKHWFPKWAKHVRDRTQLVVLKERSWKDALFNMPAVSKYFQLSSLENISQEEVQFFFKDMICKGWTITAKLVADLSWQTSLLSSTDTQLPGNDTLSMLSAHLVDSRVPELLA